MEFETIHHLREIDGPAMVLLKVTGKEPPWVGLAEDHHLVQTHPPDAPCQTLRTCNL